MTIQNKYSQANWLTYELSTSSGNCVPGSTDFSQAILALCERDGIAGFENISERADDYFRTHNDSLAAIHRDVVDHYMAQANSRRPSRQYEDFECPHNCADDCYTCDNHARHDCQVWQLVITPRGLFQSETREYKNVCTHDCTEEECDTCTCSTTASYCTCDRDGCSHDCQDSCLTCETHNYDNQHDCFDERGRHCAHDCHDAGCYDDYNETRESDEEYYETIRQYSDEWQRATQFAAMRAKVENNARLTPAQSAFLRQAFQFDRHADPIARLASLQRLLGNRTQPRQSFPRMVRVLTNDFGRDYSEHMVPGDLASIQHGLVVADTTERKDAIAWLLLAQITGSITNYHPVVITYGLRSIVRDMRIVEATERERYDLVARKLVDDTYSARLAQTIYHLSFATNTLASWLNDFIWDDTNMRNLTGNATMQQVLNVLKSHSVVTSYTPTQRASNLYHSLRALDTNNTNMTNLCPYYWLLQRIMSHHYLDARNYFDLNRYIYLPEFKQAFAEFALTPQSVIDDRNREAHYADLLRMTPLHATKVERMREHHALQAERVANLEHVPGYGYIQTE